MMPPSMMPQMAGANMPGMGPSPMGGPSPDALQALQGMQQAPGLQRVKEALESASNSCGLALQSVYQLSPKASVKLANALKDIQSARDILYQNQDAAPGMQSQAMGGAPPDLGGGMTPSPMSAMGSSGF